MIIRNMPKIECPFEREMIDGAYVVTPKIRKGFEWVFEDDSVMAIEKLHGTCVSIIIENGLVTSVFNRTQRVHFINKGKAWIIQGINNSKQRGYLDLLEDGQHFGELIGPNISSIKGNKNCYNLKDYLWIPFKTYSQKSLQYTSWGKYPKTFESMEEWMKTLMPLFNRKRGNDDGFVEGVVFTHKDGRMAKLRRDMYPWYRKERHKEKKNEMSRMQK